MNRAVNKYGHSIRSDHDKRRESRRRSRQKRRKANILGRDFRCIICLEGPDYGPLIVPCQCGGALGSFHYECLIQQIIVHADKPCNRCSYPYSDPRIIRYNRVRSIVQFIQGQLYELPPSEGEPPQEVWPFALVGIIFMGSAGLFHLSSELLRSYFGEFGQMFGFFCQVAYALASLFKMNNIYDALARFQSRKFRMILFMDTDGPDNCTIVDISARAEEVRIEEIQENLGMAQQNADQFDEEEQENLALPPLAQQNAEQFEEEELENLALPPLDQQNADQFDEVEQQ